MIADYFTKPLQGSLFRKMRDIIMGVTSFPVEERVEIRDEKSTEKKVRQTSSDKRKFFVTMVISVRPTTTVTKSEFKTTIMNNKILITRTRSRHESGFRI